MHNSNLLKWMHVAACKGVPWALGVSLLAIGSQVQRQGWLWQSLVAVEQAESAPRQVWVHAPAPPAATAFCWVEVPPVLRLPEVARERPAAAPHAPRPIPAGEARALLESTRLSIRASVHESTRVRTELMSSSRGTAIFRAG